MAEADLIRRLHRRGEKIATLARGLRIPLALVRQIVEDRFYCPLYDLAQLRPCP